MIDPAVPDRSGTPAVALGSTALTLGVVSAVSAGVPALAFVTLPWGIIAGALAVTLGAAGIHQARNGTGRPGPPSPEPSSVPSDSPPPPPSDRSAPD